MQEIKNENESITEFTIRRIRNEVIEQCAQAALWYENVETFSADDVAQRIRSLKT